MNRKQKIIVSITGIFLVLMILVGLTYAYFLTKITGNTNTKSISVTTANLVLEYGENTNVVQAINNAEPGYSVEKIFTATNKGNSTVTYGAALESIVNGLTRQEDLVYTLTCTSYLKEGFSLSSDGTITGTVDGTCNEVSTEKQFPSTSSLSVMTTNTIDTTHTHAYKLTVTYKEMNVDQSVDMNKTFSAKVNIVDVNALTVNNPYKNDNGTLKKAIIDNALLGKSTTYGSEVTTFTSASGENERVLNTAPDDYGTSYYYRGNVVDNYVKFANLTYKKDLFTGDHMYASYNYEYTSLDKCQSTSEVEKGSCRQTHKKGDSILWRIVRINGDGSIRLVLDDDARDSNEQIIKTGFNSNTDDNAYIGYMYGTAGSTTYEATHENINDSAIKTAVDKWYEDNLKTNYANYLADTLFCNDKTLASNVIIGGETQLGYGTNSTYYALAERIGTSQTTDITTAKPTFKCAENANNNYSRFTVSETILLNGNKTNGNLTYSIGLLTADEIVYAGAYKSISNKSYYLYNSSITNSWWNLSPYQFISWDLLVLGVNLKNGEFQMSPSTYGTIGGGFRPSINLKSDLLISGGDGTKENPYVIE